MTTTKKLELNGNINDNQIRIKAKLYNVEKNIIKRKKGYVYEFED